MGIPFNETFQTLKKNVAYSSLSSMLERKICETRILEEMSTICSIPKSMTLTFNLKSVKNEKI